MPHCQQSKKAYTVRKLFSLSKEDDAHQYAVRKPLNKEGKESSLPRIQCHAILCALQQRCHIALKKGTLRKISKRSQNMLNFDRRNEGAKENIRNRLPRDGEAGP